LTKTKKLICCLESLELIQMKILSANLIEFEEDAAFIQVFIQADWDYLVDQCENVLKEYFVNLKNAYPPGTDTSCLEGLLIPIMKFGDQYAVPRCEADELFTQDISNEFEVFDMYLCFAYKKAKEYLLTTDLDFNTIPVTLKFPNPRRINPDGMLNENYYTPEE
jgi:hypothetical protein